MIEEVTRYVPSEGRESMTQCIDLAFQFCIRTGVRKIVMFTATGDGPIYALENHLGHEEYDNITVIAVTPPSGRPYVQNPHLQDNQVARAGILNPARRTVLKNAGISIISAHLPFRPVNAPGVPTGTLSVISDAYGILGGGFALCIQAALVACDAGDVDVGERICTLSGDTAVTVLAARTETFLSPNEGLLLEHIICRPSRYSISKSQHRFADRMWLSHEILPSEPMGLLENSAAARQESNAPPPEGGALYSETSAPSGTDLRGGAKDSEQREKVTVPRRKRRDKK